MIKVSDKLFDKFVKFYEEVELPYLIARGELWDEANKEHERGRKKMKNKEIWNESLDTK